MRIGISTATFWPKVMTEDAFDKIRECGADLCEVFMTTYAEYTPAFSQLLKERCGGIEVHSVHTLNSQFEPQLYNSSARTRTDAEKIFSDALKSGKKLVAKYYTFHGPARLKHAVEYVMDFKKLGKVTNRLIELSAEQGIGLSYENVHWAYYSYPEYFKNLKAECPGLFCTLDIKQAMQSKIGYAEYLNYMRGSLSTVHVCDYTEEGKLCPVGRGCFPFKELFSRLKDIGCDAPVIIELYGGDYDSFAEVKESADFLKSL